MRRHRTFLLGVCAALFGPNAAIADTYFNSSEPGCDGSDPTILWCDDFEDGSWYESMDRIDLPENDGWSGTIYGRHPDSDYPGHVACGNAGIGGGAAGTNCSAAAGRANSGDGQHDAAMADHNLAGQGGDRNVKGQYEEIYFRFYFGTQNGTRFVPDPNHGGEKLVTFNRQAGSGGIDFTGLGIGSDRKLTLGRNYSGELFIWEIPGDDPHNDWGQNATYQLKDGWTYIEIHIKLNDPTEANGVSEMWVAHCGDDGLHCEPIVKGWSRNDVRWRGTGNANWPDTSAWKIGAVWLENWDNGSSTGERFYDQIVVSTRRIGPMGATPSAPTALGVPGTPSLISTP